MTSAAPTRPALACVRDVPKRTGRRWQKVKARVIRRDGGICHLCGNAGADSADHLTPASQLDESDWYDMSNLAAVHHSVAPYCNRRRGDRPIETIREELRAHDARNGWDW